MKRKTQRKGNSLNKADKLARKKLIKSTFIFSSIVALLFCYCIALGTNGHPISYLLSFKFFSIYTLITWLVVTIGYWFLAKPIYISRAYDEIVKEYSKNLAEQILIPGRFTKIILTDAMPYKELFSNFATDGQAEYYAVLGEKDNLIELFLRLKNNKKNYHLGFITKEEFISYCELAEDES